MLLTKFAITKFVAKEIASVAFWSIFTYLSYNYNVWLDFFDSRIKNVDFELPFTNLK